MKKPPDFDTVCNRLDRAMKDANFWDARCLELDLDDTASNKERRKAAKRRAEAEAEHAAVVKLYNNFSDKGVWLG